MFASSNEIGADDPSMYVPKPPAPLTRVTFGKHGGKGPDVIGKSGDGPVGTHCIMIPPGVRWSRPAS